MRAKRLTKRPVAPSSCPRVCVRDRYRDGRRVLGCGYGFPRKSVGSRHDGWRAPSLIGFWSGVLSLLNSKYRNLVEYRMQRRPEAGR